MLRADVGMAELRCLTTRAVQIAIETGELICQRGDSFSYLPRGGIARCTTERSDGRAGGDPAQELSSVRLGTLLCGQLTHVRIGARPPYSGRLHQVRSQHLDRSVRKVEEGYKRADSYSNQPWRRERDSNPRWLIATAVFKNARASPYSRSARRCLLPDSPRTVRVPHNGTVREGSMPGSRCSWTRCPTWEPRGLRAVRRSRRRRRAVPRIARP